MSSKQKRTYMLLFTTAAGATSSNQQIQRNIEKIGITVAGVKTNAEKSENAFKTDAQNIYITIKRNVPGLGEKSSMIRLSLWQIVCATLGMNGFVDVTGVLADLTYTARVAFEVSNNGNVDLNGGDFTITVENGSDGALTVTAVATDWKQQDHLKYTKFAIAANEYKPIPVNGAYKVVIPHLVSEARLKGLDTVTLNAEALKLTTRENSALIINTDGGALIPDHAVLDASTLDAIEIQNGATACDVLVIYQTDYKTGD